VPIAVFRIRDILEGKEVPATFGIKNTLSEKAVIQRRQWHKRENILKYLDKKNQSNFRREIQLAYEQPTYEATKKKLDLIKRELAMGLCQ
jgi:transposase-like protein